MRIYTDEQLVAYVDRELDDALAHEIAVAAAGDAGLAERIEVFARSRDVMAAAFESTKQEPIPERLLALFHAGPVPGARQATPSRVRTARRRWPLGLAASVVFGIGIGIAFRSWTPAAPDLLAFTPDPAVVTAALQQNVSGVPLVDDAHGQRLEVTPLSTLRLRDGTWCREFEAVAVQGSALQRATGVACRETSGGWAVRAYAGESEEAEAQSDDTYRLASGDRQHLSAVLGPFERLTATAEATALSSHWETR